MYAAEFLDKGREHIVTLVLQSISVQLPLKELSFQNDFSPLPNLLKVGIAEKLKTKNQCGKETICEILTRLQAQFMTD